MPAFLLHWVTAADFVWDEYGAFAVNDEHVKSFEVSEEEGDFAALTIDVLNPRVGLLSPGRKQWVWLSWDRAWVPLPPQQEGEPEVVDEHVPDYVPLFFGRLVGIPTNINQELVTLQFTARPVDFVAQKTALADAIKAAGAPYYDPIWINPSLVDDPDTALEALAKVWSIDRITGVVDTTDILAGEDGLEVFTESEVPYDTVEINIVTTPLRSITMNAKINWAQASTGVIDFGTRTFETYTGASTLSEWPKAGISLQAGWSVETAAAIDRWNVEKAFTASYSTSWQSIEPKHEPGDTLSASLSQTIPVLQGPGTPYLVTLISSETHSGIGEASANGSNLYVLRYLLETSLQLRYNAKRPRVEQVTFTLQSDMQPLITDAGDDETLTIDISSIDVSLPLPSLEVPIEFTDRAQYLTSERGQQSLQYLIALTRAHALQSARAIELSWPCLFERAITLSCRKNAQLNDYHLPGGTALGKVVAYSFRCDGDSGDLSGKVTIGCAIGNNGEIVAVAGDPTYCEADYAEEGWQEMENQVVVLSGGDVGYTVPGANVNDDGLVFPLTKEQVVVREEWRGSLEDQEATIIAGFPIEVQIANAPAPFTVADQDALTQLSSRALSEVMKEHAIWYDLELKPVNSGTFTNLYSIEVSQLKIPQMINLGAS